MGFQPDEWNSADVAMFAAIGRSFHHKAGVPTTSFQSRLSTAHSRIFKVMLIQRKIEIPSNIHSIDFFTVYNVTAYQNVIVVYIGGFFQKACFQT